MTCPFPNGPLLNCRREFDWLKENGLVEGNSYRDCTLTERGSLFTRHPNCVVLFKSLDYPYAKTFVKGPDGSAQGVKSKKSFHHEIHLAWFENAGDIESVVRTLEKSDRFCIVRGALAEDHCG